MTQAPTVTLLAHDSDGLARAARPSAYPLQSSFARYGFAIAVLAGVLAISPLALVAVLVLFTCAGALWRRGEPALAWCIAYQWLFICAGYGYSLVTGRFPGSHHAQHLEMAVLLSVLGLWAITVGIRAAAATAWPRRMADQENATSSYSIPRLFTATIGLFLIDWVMKLLPVTMFFNQAQVIHRLLEFRAVFFFLLLVTVLRRQRGYGYCAFAAIFILIPTLSSPMSAFQVVFILILLAVASEWRPWSVGYRDRATARRRFGAILAAAAVLSVLAVVWSGAVKRTWRASLLRGEVAQGALTAAAEFMDVAVAGVEQMGWRESAAIVYRVSSSLGYFSLVLDRVPSLLPYEGGALTMKAINHVTTPRMFFPDKPIMDSDSWLVRLYAGVSVAGDELRTSVGLTYMAQFYIDFGVLGMFIALTLFGGVLGLIYAGLRWVSPSYDLFRGAAVALFPLHFSGYESELGKVLGGMIQGGLVFAALLWMFGPILHRTLLDGGSAPRRTSARAVPGARRRPLVERAEAERGAPDDSLDLGDLDGWEPPQ